MSQDKRVLDPNAAPDVDAGDRPGRSPWQRPTVTRMSLEQTLQGPGSNIDGGSGTHT